MSQEKDTTIEINRLKALIYDTQETANTQIKELNGIINFIVTELGFEEGRQIELNEVKARISKLVALEGGITKEQDIIDVEPDNEM